MMNMADRRQKLELTWIGKDERPRLEPRILLEDPQLSYHAPKRVSEKDLFDNMLIHGDNLLGAEGAGADSHGKVGKCVFIDPPYNTGSAFPHYDDGLEHSTVAVAYPRSPGACIRRTAVDLSMDRCGSPSTTTKLTT
jgi:adenine-specific DNA-methyltransferase